MIDESSFRIVNVAASFLIAGTLSWRHFYYRSRNGWDNRARSLTSVLVFAWIGVSSGVAFDRGLPMPFTVKVSTVLLLAYLIALWTPWRWRITRPQRTSSTPHAAPR